QQALLRGEAALGWKIDTKLCATLIVAQQINKSVAASHDPQNGEQSETGSLVAFLGCKKRLKNLADNFWGYPNTSIRNLDQDIFPGLSLRRVLGVDRFDDEVSRLH